MKKKKQKKRLPQPPSSPKKVPQDIESLEPDQMLDDHGSVIIGSRSKEPKNLGKDSPGH